MKGLMNIYYDEESDFLEITMGEQREGYAEEIESGIFIRRDDKTNEVLGVGILSFKKRARNLKDITLNLPLKIDLKFIEEVE